MGIAQEKIKTIETLSSPFFLSLPSNHISSNVLDIAAWAFTRGEGPKVWGLPRSFAPPFGSLQIGDHGGTSIGPIFAIIEEFYIPFSLFLFVIFDPFFLYF